MEDRLAGLEMTQVQRRVVEFLVSQRGYAYEELEADREFVVDLPEKSFKVKADIALKVGGVRLFIVKCVMNSMESWERHSIAFCRVADSCQIPYAVVTDSENARLIDAAKGKVISEGLEAIPSRQEAGEMAKGFVPSPYPAERCEKEKRILHAFDAIKCADDLGGPKE
ncbi:MAG TPA: type I restriction enzyme HsdR N-terminal domain-containing protein [Dissulfurispiraceae bacterium]